MAETEETSLLEKLDSAVPAQLTKFDAFPKLPSGYKQRSESRGFLTLFVGFVTLLLLLNDIGEFIWGWPDYEFSVDSEKSSYMNVNVDLVVNMPCQYLSVDLRDAVGDRLYLSKGFHRDGTLFDIGQATTLKEHSAALSARQAVSQSRKSRGFFSGIFRKSAPAYRPTYNFKSDGSACRVYGTLEVKKVTANLHVTTLGHGYASHMHVDHKLMNLSHIINEFSFGPYFPDITQPLDYSYEIANDPFVAYQYFLHVVPTTYIAPRSTPLNTHQYSVTHYTRVLEHSQNTPGIFFKFDMEPMKLTIHQRTTTFIQLMIRCVGVIGGVFVCMGYAIRITSRAVDVVSGADQAQGTIAAEATGVRPGGLRAKWGGQSLHSRKSSTGRVIRQGNGWVVEGAGGSPYGTPVSGGFSGTPTSSYMGSPQTYSPYSSSPGLAPPTASNGSLPGSPAKSHVGLGLGAPSFGPSSRANTPQTGAFPTAATMGSPYLQSSPLPPPHSRTSSLSGYGIFPPTPNPINGSGFPPPPPPPPKRDSGKKDD